MAAEEDEEAREESREEEEEEVERRSCCYCYYYYYYYCDDAAKGKDCWDEETAVQMVVVAKVDPRVVAAVAVPCRQRQRQPIAPQRAPREPRPWLAWRFAQRRLPSMDHGQLRLPRSWLPPSNAAAEAA